MSPEGEFLGTWKNGDHEIEVFLPFIIFKEDEIDIVYCPALDVSGYGQGEDEAFASFKINLGEFISYTLHKKTFFEELKRLGWQIKRSKLKPMIPPSMIHLLEANDNFSRIFNNYSFKKVDRSIALPA